MIRIFAAYTLAVTMMTSTPIFGQLSSVPEQDAVEIRAALKGMEEAWNRHDMKAFVSYMTDDVEWVNVVGMWWSRDFRSGNKLRFRRSR